MKQKNGVIRKLARQIDKLEKAAVSLSLADMLEFLDVSAGSRSRTYTGESNQTYQRTYQLITLTRVSLSLGCSLTGCLQEIRLLYSSKVDRFSATM